MISTKLSCVVNRIKTTYKINYATISTTSIKNHGHPQNHTGQQQQEDIKIDKHYDVIVLGGGAAGISMACAITKNSKLSDKSVLLLDGAPLLKQFDSENYSNRVFAINKGTVQLMKSIGAWDTIKSIRIQPVKQMQVWDACSDALITFNDDKFAEDMAFIVENDVLVYAILKELESSKQLTMLNQTKTEKVRLPSDGLGNNNYGLVQLQNGKAYSCDLLIGADGANSMVRKQMGVDYFSTSYNQMGLIATVRLSEPSNNNNVAWQRFLPNGVLALLPLSDELSSIVWSTSTSEVKRLIALPENEFIDAVNHAFWKEYPKNQIVTDTMKAIESLFGNYSSHSVRQLPPCIKSLYGGQSGESRAAFPLGFGHSSSYVGKGVALIGDAAHRVHPLAGQGLNLGFGDVKCLADLLAKAAYDGYGLGDLSHLCVYENKRLRHNVPIMLGIHGIQKMYNTDFIPIVLARSVGLQLTQSIAPLKKMFINQAMR